MQVNKWKHKYINVETDCIEINNISYTGNYLPDIVKIHNKEIKHLKKLINTLEYKLESYSYTNE